MATQILKCLFRVTALLVIPTIIFLHCALDANAQEISEYENSWWTIDAGGGRSEDDRYTLQDTIGQPDVNDNPSIYYAPGSNFALRDGFWASGDADCVPVPAVDILGPIEGGEGQHYEFFTKLDSIPSSLIWSPEPLTGQNTTAATFNWLDRGAKTIQVDVVGCENAEPVIVLRTINIFALGRISGAVRCLDTSDGVANVLLELQVGNERISRMRTSTDGTYQFSDLLPNTYSLVINERTLPEACNLFISNPGGTDGNTSTFILNEGENKRNQDFEYHAHGSIGGTIKCSDTNEAIANITLELRLGNRRVKRVATDANGFYLFTTLRPETYTVNLVNSTLPDKCNSLVSNPDSTGNNSSEITIGLGEDKLRQDFIYQDRHGSISGKVNCDDVVDYRNYLITLHNASNGHLLISGSLQINGGYSFDDLEPGRYVVSVKPDTFGTSCYIPASDPENDGGNIRVVEIKPGQNVVNANFEYTKQQKCPTAIDWQSAIEWYDFSNPASIQQQVRKTPLIFIPGMSATRLVNDLGVELWPRTDAVVGSIDDLLFDDGSPDFWLRKLRLSEDGKQPHPPIFNSLPNAELAFPAEVLRTQKVVRPGKDEVRHMHDLTVNVLQGQGNYKENLTLFPYPWDWRLDIETESLKFLQCINEVRSITRIEKVDILAHSMGGLVTRAALTKEESVGKIRKVMTMGTPILGAPKALGLLFYGKPCFVEEFNGNCIYNSQELRAVAINSPGYLQLLPSKHYDKTSHLYPLEIQRGVNDTKYEGPHTYDKWSDWLKTASWRGGAQYNGKLFVNTAERYHNRYDNLVIKDPEVELVVGVGTTIDTLTRIIRKRERYGLFNLYERTKTEMVKGDGDGTVPTESADVRRLGLHTHGSVKRFVNLKHLELVQIYNYSGFGDPDRVSSPLHYAIDLFSGKSQPQNSLSAAGSVSIDNDQNGLSGTEIVTYQKAVGYISDDQQNSRGIVFDSLGNIHFEDSLDDSSFSNMDETNTLFLRKDGQYSAYFKKLTDDPLELTVRTYADGDINSQAAFVVQAPIMATLYLSLTTGQPLETLSLEVDNDANGTIDETMFPLGVVSGTLATDESVPTTTISTTVLPSGLISVTLNASDNLAEFGGLETHYIMGEIYTDTEEIVYTGPFTVAPGTELHFASVDLLGNVETVQPLTLTYPVGTQAVTSSVWLDGQETGDGIREVGELPIPPDIVTVALYSVDNTLVATTTTSAQGDYFFTIADAGEYYIQFSVVSGYSLSPKTEYSSADPKSGRTDIFMVNTGEIVDSINQGVIATPAALDVIDEPESQPNLNQRLFIPFVGQ